MLCAGRDGSKVTINGALPLPEGSTAVLDRNYRDIFAGLFLILAGTGAALYALSHYALGTVSRMGPGMMPVSLGVILAAFGLAIALPAWGQRGEAANLRLRPMVFLSAAVLAFALMIEPFGLVPAVMVTTVIATLAEVKLPASRALLLGAAMAALTWGVFIAGLRLSMPAFDWPF
jgi:hypothetical protein